MRLKAFSARRLRVAREMPPLFSISSLDTLDVKKVDVAKKLLKAIPDPRPFDVKHPVVSYAMKTGVNVGCTLFSLFKP